MMTTGKLGQQFFVAALMLFMPKPELVSAFVAAKAAMRVAMAPLRHSLPLIRTPQA